jgi:hypothetical protein
MVAFLRSTGAALTSTSGTFPSFHPAKARSNFGSSVSGVTSPTTTSAALFGR